MGFFTFLFLVSVSGMLLAVILRGMHHEELKIKHRAQGNAGGDVERSLARLEERVRTLEAIVTDPRQQVARQIAELEHGRA